MNTNFLHAVAILIGTIIGVGVFGIPYAAAHSGFIPALFFLIGDDQKNKLALLKGEYEAIETVAIQKNCNISNEIKNARIK